MVRALILSFALFLGQTAIAAPNKAYSRPELSSLQQRLCEGDENPTPQDLWNYGLYDAQVNAMRSQQPVDHDSLVAKVRVELQKNRHHGYAYGQCANGFAWMITTPAPKPVIVKTKDSVTVALPLMQGRCASVDVDFAADEGGMPRNLLRRVKPGMENALINPRFLSPGTVSVTCHPLDPKKDGPQLWALAAIQGGSAAIPQKDFDLKEFYSWLQERRSEQGLDALNINPPDLQKLADELVTTDSIAHPRALLNARGKDLKKKKINLIGENRAAAPSLSEMAWLLWNSPQHRRLILNPKANSMGLAVRGNGKEKRLVMVVGKM